MDRRGDHWKSMHRVTVFFRVMGFGLVLACFLLALAPHPFQDVFGAAISGILGAVSLGFWLSLRDRGL